MQDPSPMGMLDRRQNRLEQRIEDLEGQVEEQATKTAGLEAQVELLREGFNRNTNAMYTVGTGFLVTGVLGVLIALILKGVIG